MRPPICDKTVPPHLENPGSATAINYYRPQRSCKGYIFTGVCLSTGGVVSQHALLVASQHDLQQVSGGGMLSQHALQVVSQHALQHVSGGRGSSPGGCAWSGGVCCGGWWELVQKRRLLLRTVRIPLECILVNTVKSICVVLRKLSSLAASTTKECAAL